jgi:uncharacterized membrane protein
MVQPMLWTFFFASIACAPGTDDTGSQATCFEAPPVNHANFGEGFLLESCQGCHASTALNRHEAPEGVSFDTVDEAWAWRGRILARVVDSATMPPAGGVDADDRQMLSWWLDCAPEGT